MKSVMVLSWGMDSSTLLYKLKAEWKEVYALSFDYGQKHKKELEYAKKSCEKLWVPHKIVDITSITSLISNSALTSDIVMPEWHYADENMKKTVVPNRNMIMASIAIGYAVNIGAEEVALWVHDGDHDVYPDCRPEFIDALNKIAGIANYEKVSIYAPFLWGDKITILKEWIALWVDYALTWTDYDWGETPNYKTGSSVERNLAFIECGIKDPLYTDEQREEAKTYALEQEGLYRDK